MTDKKEMQIYRFDYINFKGILPKQLECVYHEGFYYSKHRRRLGYTSTPQVIDSFSELYKKFSEINERTEDWRKEDRGQILFKTS